VLIINPPIISECLIGASVAYLIRGSCRWTTSCTGRYWSHWVTHWPATATWVKMLPWLWTAELLGRYC